MGILDEYMKSYSKGMLGADERTPQQQEQEGGRFFKALGAAAAQAAGGRDQSGGGGVSFGDAYSKMQQQSSQTPGGQDSPDGPMPEQSPLERMKTEIQMMMDSGNPQLQKAGLSMYQKYMDKTTKGKEGKTANLKDFEAGQANPEYAQYLKDKASKSGITINTGDKGSLGTKLTEEEIAEWGLPIGGSYAHTKTGPKEIAKGAAAGDAGKLAMFDVATELTPIVDTNLFGKDGKVDRNIVLGLDAIEKGGMAGNFATKYLKPEAQQVYQALETGMQAITRTETGAAMPPEEIENTKKRFMPTYGDTDEAIKQKMDAYKYFINNATELLRPTGGDPTAIMKEAVEKSLNFVKESSDETSTKPVDPKPGDTWEENGVMYRINENGTLQSKEK